jgi:hypothetical protein
MKRIIVLLTIATLMLGVLAVGAGFANDENAAGEKCSEATLHGTYLTAYDGVEITGNDQVPFAVAQYDVFDGNGEVRGEQYDLFIAPDGSMYTFVQINPPESVASGFNLRGTAKRVGD